MSQSRKSIIVACVAIVLSFLCFLICDILNFYQGWEDGVVPLICLSNLFIIVSCMTGFIGILDRQDKEIKLDPNQVGVICCFFLSFNATVYYFPIKVLFWYRLLLHGLCMCWYIKLLTK